MSLKVSTSAIVPFTIGAGAAVVQYVVAPTDGYIGRIRGAVNTDVTGTNTIDIAVGANAGTALTQPVAAGVAGTLLGTQAAGLAATGTTANRKVAKGQIIKITTSVTAGSVASYLEIDPVDYTTSLPRRAIDNSNV